MQHVWNRYGIVWSWQWKLQLSCGELYGNNVQVWYVIAAAMEAEECGQLDVPLNLLYRRVYGLIDGGMVGYILMYR